MRKTTLTGVSLAVLIAGFCSPAFSQNQNTTTQTNAGGASDLTWANTTCSQFTQMSQDTQTELIERINGTSGGGANAGANGGEVMAGGAGGAMANGNAANGNGAAAGANAASGNGGGAPAGANGGEVMAEGAGGAMQNGNSAGADNGNGGGAAAEGNAGGAAAAGNAAGAMAGGGNGGGDMDGSGQMTMGSVTADQITASCKSSPDLTLGQLVSQGGADGETPAK